MSGVKIYLYSASKHLTYAVIASNRKVAEWYRKVALRNVAFIGIGTGNEQAVACAADKALREAIACLTANGGTVPHDWPRPA